MTAKTSSSRTGAAGPPTTWRRVRKLVLRTGGWLLVGVSVTWFVHRIDGRALGHALAQARPSLLIVATLLALAQLACRGSYLRTLLLPMARFPWLRAQRITVVSSATSALLSGRAGDLLRAYLLKRDAGVAMASTFAIIAVEKVLDLTALFIVLAPAIFLLPRLPGWAVPSLLVIAGLAAGMLLAAWVAATRRQPPRWFASFHAGLTIVRRPVLLGKAMAESLASWLLNLACFYVVMRAVGVAAPASAGLLVLLATTAAVAIPITPGGLGTFELGVVAALQPFGVAVETGLVVGLLFHAAQVLPTLVLALLDWRLLAQRPVLVLSTGEQSPAPAGLDVARAEEVTAARA